MSMRVDGPGPAAEAQAAGGVDASQLKSNVEKFMMGSDFGHDFKAVPLDCAPSTQGRQSLELDKEFASFMKDGTQIDYPIRTAFVDAQEGNFFVSVQGQYEGQENPVHWVGPFNLADG